MTLLEGVAGGARVVASSIPAHREVAGLAPSSVEFVPSRRRSRAVADEIRRARCLGATRRSTRPFQPGTTSLREPRPSIVMRLAPGSNRRRHGSSHPPVLIRMTASVKRGFRLKVPAVAKFWQRDSLVRNSAYNMMTTIVLSILGFAYWAIAAHLYATSDVGLAAALVSAMTLAATLATVGLGAAVIQLLPRSVDSKDWLEIAAAALLSAAVAEWDCRSRSPGLLLPVILPDVGRHSSALVVRFLAISAVAWSISMLLDSMYISRRETDGMLRRNTLFSAIKIPLLVIPVRRGRRCPRHLRLMDRCDNPHGRGQSRSRFVARPRAPRRVLEAHPAGRSMSSAALGHHIIDLGGILPLLALPLIVTAELSPTDNAYFYATWRTGSFFFMISAAVAMSMFAEGSHGLPLAAAIRRSAMVITSLLVPAMVLSVRSAPPFSRCSAPHTRRTASCSSISSLPLRSLMRSRISRLPRSGCGDASAPRAHAELSAIGVSTLVTGAGPSSLGSGLPAQGLRGSSPKWPGQSPCSSGLRADGPSVRSSARAMPS